MQAPDGTAFSLAPGGDGEPIVLIHGVGLDRTSWARQVPALARLGPVLSYDLLGHGQSAKPPGPCRLEDFLAQLAGLLDHLGIAACRPVGFSMGGIVARAFAAAWPERVARLVLMSTVFERSEAEREAVLARLDAAEREGPRASVAPALARWFTPAFSAAHPDVLEAVGRVLAANDPAAYAAAYRFFAEADREPGREALQRIACPVLVLTGGDDPNSTPAMAERLAAALPEGRALVLPGRRHMMPLEDAEGVKAALLGFLEERSSH